jgi:hypothetical protein
MKKKRALQSRWTLNIRFYVNLISFNITLEIFKKRSIDMNWYDASSSHSPFVWAGKISALLSPTHPHLVSIILFGPFYIIKFVCYALLECSLIRKKHLAFGSRRISFSFPYYYTIVSNAHYYCWFCSSAALYCRRSYASSHFDRKKKRVSFATRTWRTWATRTIEPHLHSSTYQSRFFSKYSLYLYPNNSLKLSMALILILIPSFDRCHQWVS